MMHLRDINKDNFYGCIDLDVREDQKDFVASNIFSLAEAWLNYSIMLPFAIYSDDTMVGFTMFNYDEAKKECEIRRLMIDQNHQGKGYGKEAMKLAIQYIKERYNPAQICLSFMPENNLAERLYTSLGFARNGELDGDEIVMVLKLH